MTLSLSLLATTAVSAFALGISIGASLMKRLHRSHETAKRELGIQLRSPLDLDPSEFSAFWQVRP